MTESRSSEEGRANALRYRRDQTAVAESAEAEALEAQRDAKREELAELDEQIATVRTRARSARGWAGEDMHLHADYTGPDAP